MSPRIKLNRTNTYAGHCCVCGTNVPSQRGYLLKGSDVSDPKLSKTKWLTLCTTRQCAVAIAGEDAVADSDRRVVLADGTIEMPYEDGTKALRRAMGSWDAARKKWVASPLYRERDHVLAVAEQLHLDVDPSFAAYDDPPAVRAAVARARAVPTIREYQVQGVRWLAYRGLTDGAPAGYEDDKPGGLLADGMGIGKQQPADTKVLTPTGWREIGSLRVGDYVIGSAGKAVRVTGVFPQGVKPSYRLTTHGAASVEAGPDHLWTVLYLKGTNGAGKVPITVTTEQLRTGAKIQVSYANDKISTIDLSKTRVYIPLLSAPVEFDPVTLPLPPYTLGALIANGSLAHGSANLIVATSDLAEIQRFLDAEGSTVRKWRSYNPTVHTGTVLGAIEHVRTLALNVNSKDKFIPEIYKRATPTERLALLHGLMDGDGSCSKTNSRVTYHTTSEKLAHDVRELVECLGGMASVRRYDRSHHNKPTDYSVRIRLPKGVPPFRIQRKLSRYNPTRFATPTRGVKSIKYVRDVESVCIAVDAADHLYVTEHALLTHNTIQTLLSVHDDEALVVVCPANAKAVWPREAAKWRPDRFDAVHVCSGEESFRWPASPRELVVINYDVLPLTPAQIKDEREKLQAERFGLAPNPAGKTADERQGKRGLLDEVFALANEYSEIMHPDRGAPLSTADRHRVYLILCDWIALSDKLHKNGRALRFNATRRPAGKPPCKFLLVFDECHYAENNKAQRTVKCRHLAGKTQRIYGLTGTPVDAEPLKLWGLLQTIRATPFTWTVFREQFSAFDGAWGGIDFLRHPPASGSTARGPVIVQPGTAEILRRCMLRRTKDDPAIAAELPPKIFSEIPIELDEKLLRECDEITATYADVLLSGELPPFEAMAGVRKAIAAACIPATLELVAEYEEAGEPLLVFSAHTKPVEMLAKRKGWYAITGAVSAEKRGQIEDEFQGDTKNNFAGAKGFGVAGTSAMATSMTLTRASTVLQVDPFWKRADNEQAYDRVHRLGQRQQVHIIRLVPDHVLVRHIADLLCGKDRFVSDVLTGAVQVDVPRSRFVDADTAEWEHARAAKIAEDRAREAAAEKRQRERAERELTEAMRRDAERLDPHTSEKRAKARYERLRDEQPNAEHIYTNAPARVVREALAFMLSVCDGAREKDNEGFNAPHSAVVRWLAPAVDAGTKYAVATAAAILRHYPRQLRERWPELFMNESHGTVTTKA